MHALPHSSLALPMATAWFMPEMRMVLTGLLCWVLLLTITAGFMPGMCTEA